MTIHRHLPVNFPFAIRFTRSRPACIALGIGAGLLAMAIPLRAELVLSGVHCAPSYWIAQGSQFTHFCANNPPDWGGLVDCNDVVCHAWLATDDIPIGTGWIPGRPIVGGKVTIHAVREDGQTSYTVDTWTDANGHASARFDDLPVTGSYYHTGCADTPSATWECYTFYASYPGIDLLQESGDCLIRLSCESNCQYYLLEDSEVPRSDCFGIPGCLDEWGGVFSQANVTLTLSGGALADSTEITVTQPPAPPPLGIPPGAAIVDWRLITTGGAAFSIPATAALDYPASMLTGYGAIKASASVSLGININLIWGLVLLVFGAFMLVGAWRGSKSENK